MRSHNPKTFQNLKNRSGKKLSSPWTRRQPNTRAVIPVPAPSVVKTSVPETDPQKPTKRTVQNNHPTKPIAPIHPENLKPGLLGKEKGAICALFALAGITICAALHYPSPRLETMLDICAVITLFHGYNLGKMVYQSLEDFFTKSDRHSQMLDIRRSLTEFDYMCDHPNDPPERTEKMLLLRREMDRMSQVPPALSRTPKIILQKDLGSSMRLSWPSKKLFDANRTNNGVSLLIDEAFFDATSFDKLRTLCASQLGDHKLRPNDILLRFSVPSVSLFPLVAVGLAQTDLATWTAAGLMAVGSYIVPRIVRAPFSRYLFRQMDFQSDRYAAGMEGSPKNLIAWYETMLREGKENAAELNFDKGLPKLAYQTVQLGLSFFGNPHPHLSRRIARLKNLDKEPSILRDFKLDLACFSATLQPSISNAAMPALRQKVEKARKGSEPDPEP